MPTVPDVEVQSRHRPCPEGSHSLTNNHSTVDAGSKKWTCYCAWEFRDVLEVWNKGYEVTRSQRPTGEAGRLDYGWPFCQAKVYKLHPEERSGQG